MTVVGGMRASDEDQQRVVDFFRDAHAVGRLQPGEFYQRLDAVYAATTWGELDDLTADLPLVWTEVGLPSRLAGRQADRRAQASTNSGVPS